MPSTIYSDLKLKVLNLSGESQNIQVTEDFLQMDSLKSLDCAVTTKSYEQVIQKMEWIEDLTIHVKEFISPCSITRFKKLKSFAIILDFSCPFEMFDCSLKEMTQLKSFTIMLEDCCWPYIEMEKSEIKKIQNNLPVGCKLRGPHNKIKSDINLR